METDVEHLAYAEITKRDDSSALVSGRIELPGGDLVAAADATFYLLSDQSGPGSPADLRQALLAAKGPT
jgi:hypothetical protein